MTTRHRFNPTLEMLELNSNHSAMGKLKLDLCLILMIGMLFASGSTAEAKRIALIIANSKYSDIDELFNPLRDAQLVSDTLKAAKFDKVIDTYNLDYQAMRKTLQEFSVEASEADVALIYYAGHGVEVSGENFLIPVDAKLKRSTDTQFEAISLNQMRTVVAGAKKLKMIVLDSCRNNPFKLVKGNGSRSVGRGLSAVEANSGEFIAYSAKEGTVAQDGPPEGNSPFAVAFAKHITTLDLDVRLAFGKVRDEVIETTNQEQEPFSYQSLGGDSLFLGNPSVSQGVQNEVKIQEARVEREYQESVRIGTIRAFTAFLSRHPEGFFSELASAQISKIEEQNKAKQPKSDADLLTKDKPAGLEENQSTVPPVVFDLPAPKFSDEPSPEIKEAINPPVTIKLPSSPPPIGPNKDSNDAVDLTISINQPGNLPQTSPNLEVNKAVPRPTKLIVAKPKKIVLPKRVKKERPIRLVVSKNPILPKQKPKPASQPKSNCVMFEGKCF